MGYGKVFKWSRRVCSSNSAPIPRLLTQVQSEVSSQKRNRVALGVAMAEKELPLSVAQARLSARAKRPGTELCQDPAQILLLAEVQELTAHIHR